MKKLARTALGWFLAVLIGLVGIIAFITCTLALDDDTVGSSWFPLGVKVCVIGVCALGLVLKDKLIGGSGRLEEG